MSGRKTFFSRFQLDLPLAAIIAVGAALRLYRLGAQSFWFDETAEMRVAMRALSQIVTGREGIGVVYGPHGMSGDVQPPLTHYVYHFWLKLGCGEFWVRLLPALLGVLTIYVLYALGRDLLGRSQGLFAAFLLAVSPFHIWYSQDARPYSFLVLFSLAGMFYFLRALRQGGRTNRLLYVVFMLAAMYSQPYAAFVFVAQMAYAALARWREGKVVSPPVVQFASIAVLFLPWVYVSVNIMGKHIQAPKPIGLSALFYTFYAFIYGFSMGPSVAQLRLHQSIGSFVPYLPLIVPMAGVVALLFIRGVSSVFRRSANTGLMLLLWLLLPIISAWALAKVTGGNYNARYASVSVPAFFLILADGFLCTRKSYARAVALVVIVITCAYSLWNYYFIPLYQKADVRTAAGYISERYAPGDVIFAAPESEFRWYYLERMGMRSPVLGFNAQSNPLGAIRAGLKKGDFRRLWVILPVPWANEPAAKDLQASLARDYRMEDRRDFTGLRVYRCAIRGAD